MNNYKIPSRAKSGTLINNESSRDKKDSLSIIIVKFVIFSAKWKLLSIKLSASGRLFCIILCKKDAKLWRRLIINDTMIRSIKKFN